MPSPSSSDILVTYEQAADLLGKSTRTVHRLRESGKLQPVINASETNGVIVRFRRADVEALVSDAVA